MKNKLFYIFGLTTAVLSSCSDDDMADMFLNGKEKTPLPVSVSLDTRGGVQTRAVDMSFKENDELLVYIEHVADNNSSVTSVDADMAPALVAFTVNSNTMEDTEAENTKKTSDLTLKSILVKGTGDNKKQTDQTTLYWDDFSDSRTEATDLRTSGHGLRPLYGYCYNGGTPDENSFKPTEGELGWTIADNQNQTSGIKTNDLLWSGTPDNYVEYNHNKNQRPGLTIPYTHAMSKVTIVLVAGDGFTGDDLKSDDLKVTLDKMYTNCTVTAPGQTITKNENYETIKDILMFKQSENGSVTVGETAKSTRTFEAVVVPGKEWSKGSLIAVIEGMDGNKYNIVATESIIKQFLKKDSWEGSDKVTFASGMNYKLTITLDKQPQDIVAKITDWSDVTAEGTGEIKFDADVKASSDVTGTQVISTSFDLWRSTTNADAASYDADGSAEGIQKASTYTYSTDKWAGSPTLYWANASTSYYFRALAKVENPATAPNVITTVSGSTAATQGTDLLWAQTSEHKGKDASGNVIQENGVNKVYAAGSAINPRTGDVPLTFVHAMSKITVELETSTGADAVDLADAKISIENIYDKGTISIKDGSIGSLDLSTSDLTMPIENFGAFGSSETNKLDNYMVIPQSLVKMANGTDRVVAEYYNASELTTIYSGKNSALNGRYGSEASNESANTSIGNPTSTATSYLTSELEHVAEVLFTSGDRSLMDAHNNAIEGRVTTSNVKTPGTPYSYETYKSLSQMPHTTDAFTQQMYDEILSTSAKDAFIKDDQTYYTLEDFKALDAAHFTEEMFNALPYTIKCSPDVFYTEAEAKAYNQELGCWYIGDVKIPAHYKLPAPAPTPHNAGDVKTVGTAIMMYIKLKDNTTYKLELPKCIAEDSAAPDNPTYVTEWEPGKHYTYKIKIVKEAISFIAMIKEWEEKSASGNATLDWD